MESPEDLKSIDAKLYGAIKVISKELMARNLAIFVGSGLSTSSGLSDWKALLKDAAFEIGLDVEKESHDLVSLAQYCFNEDSNRRTCLIDEIRENLGKSKPTRFHRLICDFPVKSIWTTNYDTLIEDSFKEHTIKKDFNLIETEELTQSSNNDVVNIYKMHGSIGNADSEIVLSTSDYEDYPIKHKGFVHALKTDLMSKTFIFIGFSFSDPNINYVLRSLKSITYNKIKPHYLFLLDQPSEPTENDDHNIYRKRREEHRIKDLTRYGIRTIRINSEDDLYDTLKLIGLRAIRDRIVLCGSDSSGEWGSLCESIGHELVQNDMQLYTCFAEGVGAQAVIGAMKYFGASSEQYPYKKLRIWPTNGVNDMNIHEKSNLRKVMIRDSAISIFVSGKDGTMDEFNFATEMGKLCIPIGFTGGTAEKVLELVLNNFAVYTKEYNLSKETLSLLREHMEKFRKKLNTFETVSNIIKITKLIRSM